MTHGLNDKVTPAWLRPAAAAVIVFVHVGLVVGAPWPAAKDPAVAAPLAIQVVPEGRTVATIAAPERAQVAEVEALETRTMDAQPSEATEVEPKKVVEKQLDEKKAPEAEAQVPEQITATIDPDAQTAKPVEAREQPQPDDSAEPIHTAALPKPRPKLKPKPDKKRAEESAPARARSRARAVSQEARAEAATGSIASANYRSIVAAELNRRKFYPPGARSSGVEGVVTVAFTIGASGRVTNHSILRSSGQPALDQAVHQMMASVSLPPPPGGVFRATVPVRFDIAH